MFHNIFFIINLDQETQETQYEYVSREYGLSLDIDFLTKDDGDFMSSAVKLSD
jgi:hypothetical protein